MRDLSRLLRGCPVAIVDTETTGLDPSTSHVLDIAVVHARIGEREASPVVAFQSLVKPPVPIPPDSTRIHGIDDALVRHAPPWSAVQDRVLEALANRLVVAFNAPFDFAMLHEEIVRFHGRDPNSAPLHGRLGALGWPWLDLLVVRKACRPRQRAGRLVEIARSEGILLDAHGAAGDAIVTALVLDDLLEEGVRTGAFRSPSGVPPRRRRRSDADDEPEAYLPEKVSDLLGWQHDAALWQEAEYASYCARRGDIYPPRFPWHALSNVPPPPWEIEPVPEGWCTVCGLPVQRVVTRRGALVLVDANQIPFRVIITEDDDGGVQAFAGGDLVRGVPDQEGSLRVRFAHGCASASIQWDTSAPSGGVAAAFEGEELVFGSAEDAVAEQTADPGDDLVLEI